MRENKLIKALKDEIAEYQLQKCLKAILGYDSQKPAKEDYSKIKGFWSDRDNEK